MNLRTLRTVGLASALALGLVGLGAPAATAVDPTTGTVTGTVTYQGSPVAGASVYAWGTGAESGFGSAVTDAHGKYAMTIYDPGTYTVRVEATSYDWSTEETTTFEFLATYAGNTVREPDATVYTIGAGSTATANIAAVAGATVTGKVVNAKGKPVANADVSATNTKRAGYAYTKTDARGNYVLKGLASGQVMVSAYSGEGIKAASGWVNVKATQGRSAKAKNVKVTRNKTGSVTATAKRLKVDDSVWAYDTKLKYAMHLGTATKKGKLKVTQRLAPGTYRLVVAGTNKASKAFTVRAGKKTKASVKAPKKRVKISGKVRSPKGKAIAGAQVTVSDSYGTPLPQGATTNAKGKYSVTGAVRGAYTVTASDPAQRGVDRTVKLTVKGKKAKKNVKLAKGFRVTGTIKHAGKAVAGISVWSEGNYRSGAMTDANGRFTLTNLPRGKQRLHADDNHPGGYLYAKKNLKVKKATSWSPKLKK